MIPLPVIHSGGTHRDCLHEDYLRAECCLHDALQAFDRIEFHSRDYHLNKSWDNALEERERIREYMTKALFYLNAHAEHTAPQLY